MRDGANFYSLILIISAANEKFIRHFHFSFVCLLYFLLPENPVIKIFKLIALNCRGNLLKKKKYFCKINESFSTYQFCHKNKN